MNRPQKATLDLPHSLGFVNPAVLDSLREQFPADVANLTESDIEYPDEVGH
jgi:hypothetical protein